MDAMTQLRIIRDAYLKDMDGEVLKYISMGQSVPQGTQDYLQALRDLPSNATPTLDEQGNLDPNSVTFPTKETL